MALCYVRAIHDFSASGPDELSLRKGDVAQIKEEIDTNWVRGVSRGLEGVFPVTFVQPLSVPSVEAGQRVFAAIEDFNGGEAGDLCFQRGDIVIGTSAVDHNWWEGFTFASRAAGIFPVTHVEELLDSQRHTTQSFSGAESSMICEGLVITSLCAQLDDELDLVEGDTVQILQFIDDNFAIGRCKGKTGQFPLSFVEIKHENSVQSASSIRNASSAQSNDSVQSPGSVQKASYGYLSVPGTDPRVQQHNNDRTNGSLNLSTAQNTGYHSGKKSHSRKGSYTEANTRSHDAFVVPYAQTRYPFIAESDFELSFNANEIVTLISHIDEDWAEGEINGRRGIFPTSYVNVIVDCQPVEEVRGQNGAVNNAADSPERYGRVLYDFTADNADELSLCEGDTVTILQQLDTHWYLAQHDDTRVGRCPVSYVEVFGSEPLHGVTTPSAVNQETEKSHHTALSTKPKPAVKPKPTILKTAAAASKDVNVVTSRRSDTDLKQYSSPSPTPFEESFLKKDLQSPDRPPILRKQPTNVRMSLDTVVQRELQLARKRVGFQDNAIDGPNESLRNHPAQRSVSVVEGHGHVIKVESERASESPTPTPVPRSTLRPNSLSIEKGPKQQGAKSFNKTRPSPPPRLPGLVVSPSNSKIVPKRPAPPCPTSAKSNRSHSHNDLMMFSPELGASDVPLHANCSTPTMDLPSNSTQPRSRSVSAHSSNSDAENLQMEEKRRDKRQRVILELMQTESDYVNSLVLCLKTFSSRSKLCPPTLDLEMLFGNADEVVELSQRLLSLLEQNVDTQSFEMQCVGKCFIELKDQFQRVYAPYCRNHDSVIALLEKYEGNQEVSEFIRASLDQMRTHSQVFDLNSILIKPVQRILKYPLLLSELERSTENNHVDKSRLVAAITTMTHIAAYINEYKRRKDLVFKYKQETDAKFSDKIGRLTMHSTMKKLSRISRRMVGIQIVDERFNYEEQRFKALDSAIRNLARDISQYVEQCQNALECRELSAVNIAEFYCKEVPEIEIEKYCEVHSQISKTFFLEFKASIESDILPPLNSLMLMYQGPHKVIRKRHDKLLDYDNAASRLRSAGDSEQAKAMDEELDTARKNYEALNAQLLEDLPKLHSLSMEIFIRCLTWFIGVQTHFIKSAVEKLHNLTLPLILGTGSSLNIVEAFNIAHAIAVEKVSDISFIPKSFNPQVDEVRKMKERRSTSGGTPMLIDIESTSNQCEGQRSYLKQKYPASSLFWVTQDFTGQQTLDLNLSAGALVAVIKEGDPMGNRDRWFVDNGAEKGFITKQFLSGQPPNSVSTTAAQKIVHILDWLDPSGPTQPNESKSASAAGNSSLSSVMLGTQLVQPSNGVSTSHWVKCDDDDTAFSVQSSQDKSHSAFLSTDDCFSESAEDRFQAIYDFSARSNTELSVREGDIVQVLQRHDLDGNSEWWHVESADGRKGYVPASYLYGVRDS